MLALSFGIALIFAEAKMYCVSSVSPCVIASLSLCVLGRGQVSLWPEVKQQGKWSPQHCAQGGIHGKTGVARAPARSHRVWGRVEDVFSRRDGSHSRN